MVGASIKQWRGQQTDPLARAHATRQGFEPPPWLDPLWHRARQTVWQATDLWADLAAEAGRWQEPTAVRTLLACAEFHGMVPLLAHHLRPGRAVAAAPARASASGPVLGHVTAEGLAAPVSALRRPLAAAQARHRHATGARQQALAELLHGCAARGIPTLLLKGAALANTVYPTPALRPMRDLDVLTEPAAAPALLHLLAAHGFVPAGDAPPPGHHHLPGQVRLLHGVPVHVEVHTRLGLSWRQEPTTAELFAAAVPCSVDGAPARMPAPAHMLWHVAHHGFAMPFITEASKLIWYADLRAMVGAWGAVPGFAEEPEMRRVLRQLAATRPWPPATGAGARSSPRSRSLAPLPAHDYAGWPRVSLSEGPRWQRLQAWRATLLPPRFWLGMRHRVAPTLGSLFGAWCLHLRDLGQQAWAFQRPPPAPRPAPMIAAHQPLAGRWPENPPP